jgi:hypothetical protein
MEFAPGPPPSQWIVTLRSGGKIELAADGFREEDGYAVFDIIVDATPDEQAAVRVVGRSPIGGPRVFMMVAKIAMSDVDGIVGGWPWPQDEQKRTAADPIAPDHGETGGGA